MKRLARGVLACVDPRGRREDDVELGGIAKPKPREPKEPDVTAEAKSGAEKMRADLRAIAPEHARGTRRARVLLATLPIVLLLMMLTRPLYAPLIDVFAPVEPAGGGGAGGRDGGGCAGGARRRLMTSRSGKYADAAGAATAMIAPEVPRPPVAGRRERKERSARVGRRESVR